MAREQRKDVDYFPHECTHGRKMHIVEERYGNDGYATWFKLLEQLGKANNHYIDVSDEMTQMFLSSIFKINIDLMMRIFSDLSKLNAIDKTLFEEYNIIYSHKFCDSIIDAYRNRKGKMVQYNDILDELKAKKAQSYVRMNVKGINLTEVIHKEEKSIEEKRKEKERREENTLTASPVREKIDFQEIITIFNSVCINLPKAETIGEKRKTAIRMILKNHSMEQIGDVFRNVSQSDFLNGRVTNFSASFDWIIKPANFIKILENNYKNNGKQEQSTTEIFQSAVTSETGKNFRFS